MSGESMMDDHCHLFFRLPHSSLFSSSSRSFPLLSTIFCPSSSPFITLLVLFTPIYPVFLIFAHHFAVHSINLSLLSILALSLKFETSSPCRILLIMLVIGANIIHILCSIHHTSLSKRDREFKKKATW
ncbi:hypothetical protein EJ08DRAFT_165982 [Tothia fuscella]|uniref:Uncharacterized protein n=1 Tax=Tothia fuscella TaxID=1048955 RepID=A0A9P4NV75_9PEZI|nr:hypothetical protein EJ08DRAFT_165982 [Tothia fuscella]